MSSPFGTAMTIVAGVVLILLAAFVAGRLVRARTSGMSIRLQLFVALAMLISAFAVALAMLVLNRVELRATLLAQNAARAEARAVAIVLERELASRGATLEQIAAGFVDAGRDEQALAQVVLLDLEGRPIGTTEPLPPDEMSTVAFTHPIEQNGVRVGSVHVVKPTLAIARTIADFTPLALAAGATLLVLAAACAAWIGAAIARPIEALTDFAERVSEGERRAPPPPAHGREVQRLSRAIDSMRRELEGRPFVETFAADLSHELKNPVAAIRASAEVLADGALDEPEEAARFVGRIQEATSRIEMLLGDLLSLARIEARGVEQAAVVDLADLAQKSAARARERGGDVLVVTPATATVRGDALWLARALDNLVDNARTHGEAATPVRLELLREGREVVLAVRNRGHIVRHVEKRLFRRFVTTRADRGGTGLGLAIVRAIAEAHSGSAECAAAGPPDVVFRITLPAA